MSNPRRDGNGRFARGNPGGPGRPRSAVSAAASALDQAAADAHQELMRIVLEQARAGNLEATKMLWSRIWPVRRGRPIAVDLPPIAAKSDVLPAQSCVTEAMLSGELTADEAAALRGTIAAQEGAIRAEDFRRNWEELKAKLAAQEEADGDQ